MSSPTKPARTARSSVRRSARPPVRPSSDYGDAFPNSKKVYLEGPQGIRVPVREIGLSGGEPPLRVYDTSGPQGFDVREGLPALREDWIGAREVTSPETRVRDGASRETRDPRVATRARSGSALAASLPAAPLPRRSAVPARSRSSTTRGGGISPKRWSSLPCARGSRRSSSAAR